jgi:rod shape-determining protein MreC
LPLISINMQQSANQNEWYGEPFHFMASQVQSAYYGFSQGVRSTTSMYLNLISIKKDNLGLKHQNAELKAQLAAMTELKLENERMMQLFQFKNKHKMELLAARVIARDILPDHATILIDRGMKDGLKPGQAVITVEGAVGHVFRVGAFTSRVMLITDRYSVVHGIVQRSRAVGIVEGKSSDHCLLRYVNKSEDVMAGDIIVTSGLDNIFPKGMPVASVENVEKKPYSVNLEVDLKPVVDPNKLEELFIVLGANNEDLAALADEEMVGPRMLLNQKDEKKTTEKKIEKGLKN